MAQLTDEQKDRISHRGRAFRALREAHAKRAPEALVEAATRLKVGRPGADDSIQWIERSVA